MKNTNKTDMEWLLEEKYGGEKSAAFFTDCKRLALGEPLAYLIGFVPFLNCKIWLDKHPLIPRPETEFWINEAIDTLKNSNTPSLGIDAGKTKILDLCAGSGCIGVALAKALPDTAVDLAEIDTNLITTIQKNITENITDQNQCRVVHSNLFTNLAGKYDFIFSNPPYIDESLDRTDESVKTNEPYLALFGGEKGMEIITSIISKAPEYLAPGGQLWIEHEPEQTKDMAQLANKHNFLISTHKDQYNVERYSILVLQ